MSAAAPIRQPETADEANEKLLEKGLIPAVQKESISAKSSKKVKLPEDEEPKVGKFTIGPAPVRDWEMVPPDGKWGWCILVGPLSSILSVKWSYRTVTLIGGSFAAFGMIFSSWAFSIGYLYVRGAVLILGGIMLNVWAAALLFQPVEEHMVKKYKEVEEDEVPQYMSTPFHGSTLSAFEKPSEFASQFSLKSITESLAPISYCCGCKKRKADDTNKEPNKYFDIELLKDPIYLVILISNSTCAISYTNFIILVPSYAQELGFDKTLGAYLLSIISALDLVGRIGGSALSDVVTTPKRYFFITGLLLSGISLSLMPLVNSYSAISAFCCVFGLASGINVGVTALVMTEMLGTERLMSSYGISLFVNGILQLIGPPVCGIWYENTKSYKSLFVTLGIILVFGASLWSVVPMILRKRKQKENAVSA
ncbi:unnamed protein product [Leptidea sinapis]|uniref:Major facilitator superfamily (MFS) profile domain-containing protein n=2 Tax=Leptidea sinapis TaxID=189913 RepID=A0A5E4Q1G4_9NEOP|nr:unnamed protein product [Leptidea sinapis]